MNLKVKTGDKQAKNRHANHVFCRTVYLWTWKLKRDEQAKTCYTDHIFRRTLTLKSKTGDKQAKNCHANHVFCSTLYLWTWKLKQVINKLKIVIQITFFVGLCAYEPWKVKQMINKLKVVIQIVNRIGLGHLVLMHHFSTLWKYEKTVRFSGNFRGWKGFIGNKWVK